MNKTEFMKKRVPWDSTQLRKIQKHPCYSDKACHLFGRIHLPVAPYCNIQCNYCIRKFDCVNESRPGVTSTIREPQEAFRLVKEVINREEHIKVVAVAGPGDPLYNEETFETLSLIKKTYPYLLLCLSTNGLLLPERVDDIAKLGVSTLTVTLNAIDPDIGQKIYSSIEYKGKKYRGRDAAELLIKNQLQGIREAIKRKILIKVNTVYIPSINEGHIIDIAKFVAPMNVYVQNIIPLIPQYKFDNINPPTLKEKKTMQDKCGRYIQQMVHCQRCRSDAIGKLGRDIQDKFIIGSIVHTTEKIKII